MSDEMKMLDEVVAKLKTIEDRLSVLEELTRINNVVMESTHVYLEDVWSPR